MATRKRGRPDSGVLAGYVRLEVYVPIKLREALDRAADREQQRTGKATTRADVVRRAMREFLDRELQALGLRAAELEAPPAPNTAPAAPAPEAPPTREDSEEEKVLAFLRKIATPCSQPRGRGVGDAPQHREGYLASLAAAGTC